jgi:hypothetical protein
MHYRTAILAGLLVLLALPVAAQEQPCSTRAPQPPAAVSRTWWEAFALGKTESLAATSARVVSFVASNGRTFDRAELLAEAKTHGAMPVEFEWKDESVRHPSPEVAIVTGRVTERIAPRPATYRYLAVLECTNDRWLVAAAQNSREVASSNRIAAADAGALDDFAGEYRTPLGKTVRVALSGTNLVLIDPSGGETRLEPIAPAVFEVPGVSFQGLIRFVFARNGEGKVISMTRLTADVITFPRAN